MILQNFAHVTKYKWCILMFYAKQILKLSHTGIGAGKTNINTFYCFYCSLKLLIAGHN